MKTNISIKPLQIIYPNRKIKLKYISLILNSKLNIEIANKYYQIEIKLIEWKLEIACI